MVTSRKCIKYLIISVCVIWSFLYIGYVSLLSETNLVWETLRYLDQEDRRLIKHISKNLLIYPDNENYNISNSTIFNKFSLNGIEAIQDILFGSKKNGVFVEAGAYDGEYQSNTLYLERNLSWSGLLIEPVPSNIIKIQRKHRKSIISPVCLSSYGHPTQIEIVDLDEMSHPVDSKHLKYYRLINCGGVYYYRLKRGHAPYTVMQDCKNVTQDKKVTSQCYPLYSILKAANIDHVHFFSLDIEGNELNVLRTIPFNQIRIDVILVEIDKLFVLGIQEIEDFMKLQGYKMKLNLGKYNLIKKLPRDRLFVRADSVYAAM